jgi:hypothetical protein
MRLFEGCASPFQTFRCMVFHRHLNMIHINGGEHLITCKICESKNRQDMKNELLTILYFNRGWCTLPFMVPIICGSLLHRFLTGQQSLFEYPPEHRRHS